MDIPGNSCDLWPSLTSQEGCRSIFVFLATFNMFHCRDASCNIMGRRSCKMTARVWVIKVLYSFFLNLGSVKFHRHTNSVCCKKCLRKVLLCCLRVMKSLKRIWNNISIYINIYLNLNKLKTYKNNWFYIWIQKLKLKKLMRKRNCPLSRLSWNLMSVKHKCMKSWRKSLS